MKTNNERLTKVEPQSLCVIKSNMSCLVILSWIKKAIVDEKGNPIKRRMGSEIQTLEISLRITSGFR